MASYTIFPSLIEIGFRPGRVSITPSEFGKANCLKVVQDGGDHAAILEIDEESVTYIRDLSEDHDVRISTSSGSIMLHDFIDRTPRDGEEQFRQHIQGPEMCENDFESLSI